MILMPDLFSFAYVPNWYSQLDMLAEMALPEPWRFKNPIYLTKNPDTPILERYIHAIFKKQLIDYKDERNPSSAADYFHIENEFCCFHTGLYIAFLSKGQSSPQFNLCHPNNFLPACGVAAAKYCNQRFFLWSELA